MSTLLHNDIAPLWVWIVVIAIGSLLIIGTSTVVVYIFVSRRRKASGLDIEADGVLTRRLTLKRGKLIPNDRNDSESHSRRGLMSPGETTSTSTPRSYSKSLCERKTSMEIPSTSSSSQSSPSTIHRGNRYSRAPRLSLGSLDVKEPLTTFGSLSDLSIMTRPEAAATIESRNSKTVNFSRPQFRPAGAEIVEDTIQATVTETTTAAAHAPTGTATATATTLSPPPPKRGRLSVINETTPRNSFIGRIVSWAGSSHEADSKRPEMQQRTEETAPRSSLVLPATTNATSKSPLLDALRQLQQLTEAPTPELPSRHPSRMASFSDDATISGRSRSSSINDTKGRPTHNRTDSNFSRRSLHQTHSRSSSITNFSRPQQSAVNHSRTSSNASWLEEPRATLTEPFDTPVMIAERGSRGSLWSADANRTMTQLTQLTQLLQSAQPVAYQDHHQHDAQDQDPYHGQTMLISPISSQADTVSIRQVGGQSRSRNSSISSFRNSVTTTATTTTTNRDVNHYRKHSRERNRSRDHSQNRHQSHSRNQSRSSSQNRSKGSTKFRTSTGHHVLRKKSLQIPQITMIGPVDPASLGRSLETGNMI